MALPSIKDNITTTLEEFKVEAFGIASENEEYIANLFGIEDLVGGLTGVLDFISEFADAMFKFLEDLFEMFELPDFDLGSILSAILGMIGGGMANGSLQTRADLQRISDNVCPGARNDKMQATNIMKRFALTAVVLAMGCNGDSNAFSTLLNMHYGENASNVEVPSPKYLDELGLFTNEITEWILNEDEIDKATSINNTRSKARSEVDKAFYPLISTIIPNIQNGAVTGYLSDMYNTGLVTNAVQNDPLLYNKVVKSYNNNYHPTEQPTKVLRDIEEWSGRYKPVEVNKELSYNDLKDNPYLKEAYRVAVRSIHNNTNNPNDDIREIPDNMLNLF